jgi:hypothetical protein
VGVAGSNPVTPTIISLQKSTAICVGGLIGFSSAYRWGVSLSGPRFAGPNTASISQPPTWFAPSFAQWQEWLLSCLNRAIKDSQGVLSGVLNKTRFWQRVGATIAECPPSPRAKVAAFRNRQRRRWSSKTESKRRQTMTALTQLRVAPPYS